ncbi:MAG: hypothetical protein ABSE20_14315 [Acetobacteraceae bacterium]|jgi:hypothetical protein
MPPGDRADGEEIPWGTVEEVGVGCNGGRDMGIGSLGWGGAEATGDGGGGGGVSGFAGMTIEGSGSRAVVVIVVGGVAGELGVARVSGRGTGFSGPAAIT